MFLVKIAVPLAIFNEYAYLTDLDLYIGDLVNINFNGKNTIGLVIEEPTNFSNIDNKIKYKIIGKKIEYSLGKKNVLFIKWVSKYNMIPIGIVFKFMFSSDFIDKITDIFVNVYKFRTIENKKITKQQQNVIDFLQHNCDKYFTFKQLSNLCSLNILKTLVKNECITKDKKNISKYNYNINVKNIELNRLTVQQQEIYEKILTFNNKPILLEGVTGSGKTEIYFHLFEYFLKQNINNQILFLLPEISLTSQFMYRFKQQFNCEDIAVWHSNITTTEKKYIWKNVLNGNIKIVLGARSSLFLPFQNLKLIIVDEEHDSSYKQTDNGCYNARDMAVVRAKIFDCKIVLGSATPSLETLVNVENKKYNYCFLSSKFGVSTKPLIEIVNLQKNRLGQDKFLSKKLVDEIETELNKQHQILLFMNRRGYAPIAICRECGYRFSCKYCSANLTVHKNKGKFICHQCGNSVKETHTCPNCKTENSIIFFGPGVEKIQNEVQNYFPKSRSVIITSDTINNISQLTNIVNQIQNKEVDIIIGTQIITKGYDFNHLNLVGVLDADASLFGANFRSTEKTFQLLTQVIGRAGRRKETGKAIIQTYNPDNLIIESLKNDNRNELFKFEKNNRQLANLPPFGQLIMIIFYGKKERDVYTEIKKFVASFTNNSNFEILGPTPTTMYRINSQYRFKVLFKSHNNIDLQSIILNKIKTLKPTPSVNIKIDVNPYFII